MLLSAIVVLFFFLFSLYFILRSSLRLSYTRYRYCVVVVYPISLSFPSKNGDFIAPEASYSSDLLSECLFAVFSPSCVTRRRNIPRKIAHDRFRVPNQPGEKGINCLWVESVKRDRAIALRLSHSESLSLSIFQSNFFYLYFLFILYWKSFSVYMTRLVTYSVEISTRVMNKGLYDQSSVLYFFCNVSYRTRVRNYPIEKNCVFVWLFFFFIFIFPVTPRGNRSNKPPAPVSNWYLQYPKSLNIRKHQRWSLSIKA